MNLTVGGTGAKAMALMGQLVGLAPHTAGLLKQAGDIAGASGGQGAAIGGMAMGIANSLLGFFTGGGLGGREGVVKSGDTTKDAGDQLRQAASTVGGDTGGILSSLPGVMNTIAGSVKTRSVGIADVQQVGVSKLTNVGKTSLESVGKFKKTAVGEEFVIEVGDSKFIVKSNGEVIILGKSFNFVATDHFQMRGKPIDMN
jgi:type VI secretion system secreted protein VgrG